MEVLIVGNGISRLAYNSLIREYPGEVWACNRAYLEFGPKLTRITGHADVMQEAMKFRDDRGYKFEIWGGHLGRPIDGAKPFTVDRKWLLDSGTSLVAQALHEDRNVLCVGFDLGGPDLKSPGLETVDKTAWVIRWRNIFQAAGVDRIRWVGHDHTPFLLSKRPAREYARNYLAGLCHIKNQEYLDVYTKLYDKPALTRLGEKTAMEKKSVLVIFKIDPEQKHLPVSEKVAEILVQKGDAILAPPMKPALGGDSVQGVPEVVSGAKKRGAK